MVSDVTPLMHDWRKMTFVPALFSRGICDAKRTWICNQQFVITVLVASQQLSHIRYPLGESKTMFDVF